MASSDSASPLPAAWLELPDKRMHVLAGDCYLGRIEGNQIVIGDHRVSRRHAVVRSEGSRFVVADLGSTNGTFVNGTRISRPTLLHDGDELVIGGHPHTFCQPSVTADEGEDFAAKTAVIVGKTVCWLLAASGPKSDATTPPWLAAVQSIVARSGGITKSPGEARLAAHWRADLVKADVVRTAIVEIATLGQRPSGSCVAMHYAAVRVGAATAGSAETVLGAEVAFTHSLEAAATELRVNVLLSEPAAMALQLGSQTKLLGSRQMSTSATSQPLFSLELL
jgi:pSer/pThr/pTyr-binding forkhead associated (FHA) protein